MAIVASLDDLEIGIKQLLLENCGSFSDVEISQLNECLARIQFAKITWNVDEFVAVVATLTKIFAKRDDLKDFF